MSTRATRTDPDRDDRLNRETAPTRVLLADDDVLGRAAARELLADDPALTVVGEVAIGDAPSTVGRALPDVVVLDADLCTEAGRRQLVAVRAVSPRVRVLVLTDVREPLGVLEGLAAGASGYLLKANAPSRLARFIHDVTEARVAVDRDMVAAMRERLQHDAPATRPDGPEAAAPEHPLTARQLTVLRLVAAGMTNEEIARELVLSPGTAKLHVQHIINKLGVANRTQAAVYAARHGLLAGD